MEGVWYVVCVLVMALGVKYFLGQLTRSPRGPRSSNTYPDSGDLMTEVRDKWKRPLASLPVHVDIPRLARKISIFTSTANHPKQPIHVARDELTSSNDSTTENMVIKDLIRDLAQSLDEPITQQESIEANFLKYFKKTADCSQALAEFLEEIVGHGSITANVLKACNQSVLAPGVLKLKFAIGNHFPYKDARGSWRIEIVVGSDFVSVEHIKSEKSFDDSPLNYFEFSWALKLTFDRDVQTIKDIDLYIVDTSLSDSMNPNTKREVHNVMKPFLRKL